MLPTTIAEHCGEWEDPRCAELTEHRLLDSVTVALCAVLAGADSWVEVAACGRTRAGWRRTVLELPHAISSHDTFGRVFAHVCPEQFAAGCASWVQALRPRLPRPAVHEPTGAPERPLRAVDGKQVRRSHGRVAGHPAWHLVSGWAGEARLVLVLVLAHQAVADHSNAITALPRRLEPRELTGGIGTIDALGCPRTVAAQSVEQGADYATRWPSRPTKRRPLRR